MSDNEKRIAILASLADSILTVEDLAKGGHMEAIASVRGMIADCIRHLRYYQPGTPEHNAELREGIDIARDAIELEDSDGLGLIDTHDFHRERCNRWVGERPTLASSAVFLADLVKAGWLSVACEAMGRVPAIYTVLASPVYIDSAEAMEARYRAARILDN